MEEQPLLDAIDRKILDIIQTAFPLVSRPYAEIGAQVGISEKEACERVGKMRNSGVIRRLGANFHSGALGWVSTLCAASVPPEKMESFIGRVNREQGVTHNYLRDHAYNVWFTLISPSKEARQATLAQISADTGVEILDLPAARMYKIKVDFPMG